jgi:hypothetical protein
MKIRSLLLVGAAVLLSACSSSSTGTGGVASSTTTTPATSSPSATPSVSPSVTYTAPPATLPVPGTGVTFSTAAAPWPAPVLIGNGAQSAAYVASAGLPYAAEMLRVHYHAHIDINVDGKAVQVPQFLGWVVANQKVYLAPLHTHDASGIIHIENSVPATFVLGQVFAEWGVRFTPTCMGAYCSGAGHELAFFVDGKRYTGDPTRIVLTKHAEIAIEYAASGHLPTPPSSYTFPNSL